MDIKEIGILLSTISEYWPNFQLPDGTTKAGKEALKRKVQLWHRQLGPLESDLVFEAIDYLVKTSQFPPTIADLFNAISVLNPLDGDDLLAEEAFERLLFAVTKYGRYRMSEGLASLPDPVRETAKIFSWSRLCSENTTDLRFLMRDFKEVYQQIRKRLRTQKLKRLNAPQLTLIRKHETLQINNDR